MLGVNKIVKGSTLPFCACAQYIKCSFYIILIRNKHWNPKFKWHRAQKFLPIDLPDFQEKVSKEKERTRLKELGIEAPRFWKVKPVTITSLTEILEPYVPPKADGKASLLNKKVLNTMVSSFKTKKNNIKSVKKIRSYDKDFDTQVFPQEAHDIYVKAHTVLMNKDPEELSNYVTEKANLEMMDGLKLKTLKWKFIESLEAPVVVQTRVGSAVTDSNLFAQVTVRFHTKQTLAIYDRFGRLLYGNEIVPKDVLEYVIFEKHIVNVYGVWRMHGKIIPDWMPPKDPTKKTYRVENYDDEDDEEEEIVEEDHEGYKVKLSE